MRRNSKIVISVVCALSILCLILYPAEMIEAAKGSLGLFINSVFPSVFPFLVISSVLIEIRAVSKFSRLFEPIMRPVFNVPGCGAFAFVMGIVSGYPVGAKITADFRAQGELTKAEAQRLLSFCSNCGPLFMVGVAGTAILGSAWAGYFILAANYAALLVTGILFRFYGTGGKDTEKRSFSKRPVAKRLSLGNIMGNAVKGSLEVSLQICGFIIIFGVLTRIMYISGIMDILVRMCLPLFKALSVDGELCAPLIAGVFEITGGLNFVAAANADLPQKAVLACVIVTFGGLSILAQVASFFAHTDLSASVYIVSKIIQSALSAIIGIMIYPLFESRMAEAVPVFSPRYGDFGSNLTRSVCMALALCAAVTMSILMTRKRA